jgi:uncharacterized membrane protein
MTGGWRILFWLVLGASLMANAVALGLLLRLGALRDSAMGEGARWSDLPAETRSAFRAELSENRGELAGLVAEVGKARSAMFTAATARPYDRAAVETAQARVREASAALQQKAQALMLEAFDKAAEPDP